VHVEDGPGDVATGDRAGFSNLVTLISFKVTFPKLPFLALDHRESVIRPGPVDVSQGRVEVVEIGLHAVEPLTSLTTFLPASTTQESCHPRGRVDVFDVQAGLILELVSTIERKAAVCVESCPDQPSGRVVIADPDLVGEGGNSGEQGEEGS